MRGGGGGCAARRGGGVGGGGWCLHRFCGALRVKERLVLHRDSFSQEDRSYVLMKNYKKTPDGVSVIPKLENQQHCEYSSLHFSSPGLGANGKRGFSMWEGPNGEPWSWAWLGNTYKDADGRPYAGRFVFLLDVCVVEWEQVGCDRTDTHSPCIFPARPLIRTSSTRLSVLHGVV